MPFAKANRCVLELVSEGLIVQCDFQTVGTRIEPEPAIPRAAREEIIWRTPALDQPTAVIAAGPIVEFCFESAEYPAMFRLERKKIEADGKAVIIQTGDRSDGAIASRSPRTVVSSADVKWFINAVEIQDAVNKWRVREFHWRALVDHVSGIGAERKKGDENIGVGAGGSSRGHENEAAPERIHGIRFARTGRNAKKKKGSGTLLCANRNRFVSESPWTD